MNYFLTIAASDNSGGAGIQQDIKVAGRLGYWPLSAITGITVQDFNKLDNIYPVTPAILSEQIEKNIKSFKISAVKIGAVCSEENIDVISRLLKKYTLTKVVLDPVFAPSHGKYFISKKSIELFRDQLLPLVDVITPNKNELSLLAGKKLPGFEESIEEGKQLLLEYGCNIFLKGGHFEGDEINEALITDKGVQIQKKKRLIFKYSHGTGCTFSTALSCYLGNGMDMSEACQAATAYVSNLYSNT